MSNKKPSRHQYNILKMLSERSILMERNGRYSWDSHVPLAHRPKVNKRTFAVLMRNGWIKKGVVFYYGENDFTQYHLSDDGEQLLKLPEPDKCERPLTQPQKDAMLAFNCGWWLRCINGRFYWDLERKMVNPSLVEITNNIVNKITKIPRISTLKRLLKDKLITARDDVWLLTDGNVIRSSKKEWGTNQDPVDQERKKNIIELATKSNPDFSGFMSESIKTHWALQDAGEMGTHNAEVFRYGGNDD